MINDKGEILTFTITQASDDDRTPLKQKRCLDKIFGKLFADKDYIGKDLVKMLFIDRIQLITNMKNNMKNPLMTLSYKILLRKKSVIETVNDALKNICQVEHSRHRSFGNFLSNMVSGLIAYSFLPKKPQIKFPTQNTNQICLF